jgi:HK97 gp10 family phage protein
MPIELTGVNELFASLEKTGKNIRQISGKALSSGAEIIRKAAADKCPRGSEAEVMAKKYAKGQHLADNITISSPYRENGADYVDVGPARSDNNEFFYGKFFEFGTVKMAAKPFVEPALIEKKDEALEKIAEVIKAAIERGD